MAFETHFRDHVLAPAAWHAAFLDLMPSIRRQVRRLFKCRSRHDRAEALAETTAVAMIYFLERLKSKLPEGMDHHALVHAAALSVLRRVGACGPASSGDVLSPVVQKRCDFKVEQISDACPGDRLGARIALRRDWRAPDIRRTVVPRENGAPANGAPANGKASLAAERRRRRKAEKSVRIAKLESDGARQIQQKLFPAAAPVLAGFEVAGMTCPADATGGDYFDYVPMLNGGVGIVLGDVSGHGFGPALLMAATRAYLRAFAQTHSDLGGLLSLVNRVLSLDMEDSRFVTLVLASLDPGTRSLIYVSAGHPTGYVLSADGDVRARLPSTGLPLGIGFEDYLESAPISLRPGELVLLLSDGITEAVAPDGTAFGANRAVDIVRIYRHDPAVRLVANLYHAVRAFAHNRPQLDDFTTVVIKVGHADDCQSSVTFLQSVKRVTGVKSIERSLASRPLTPSFARGAAKKTPTLKRRMR